MEKVVDDFLSVKSLLSQLFAEMCKPSFMIFIYVTYKHIIRYLSLNNLTMKDPLIQTIETTLFIIYVKDYKEIKMYRGISVCSGFYRTQFIFSN